MTQGQIEQMAGIDQAVADHMMAKKTAAARSAMALLSIQCQGFDPGGMAMLQQAVKECRKELGEDSWLVNPNAVVSVKK